MNSKRSEEVVLNYPGPRFLSNDSELMRAMLTASLKLIFWSVQCLPFMTCVTLTHINLAPLRALSHASRASILLVQFPRLRSEQILPPRVSSCNSVAPSCLLVLVCLPLSTMTCPRLCSVSMFVFISLSFCRSRPDDIVFSLQYDSAEWKPAFLRQAREFLCFPLLPREASLSK